MEINHQDIEKTLKALKLKIQKAKDDLAEAKAQKRVLLNTLKKDFGIENLIDADAEIKKLTKELSLLNVNIEEDYTKLKEKFDEVKVSEKYKAKVIGFSDFGVFCEVDGIEGLIHISEISWSKIIDPSKSLKVGQEVDVIVVEKNADNYKLNLSMKRLTPDPWIGVEEKYPKDKQFEGELIRKEKYGFIIRLTEGIEGLIHVSKIGGSENLEIGTKVKVYIEKVDVRNRRISLILVSKEKPVAYR